MVSLGAFCIAQREIIFYRLPLVSFWLWRKIFHSRDWCRGMFVSCIGDGSLTSLWLDYYLSYGQRFRDFLPFKTLSSTGLSWDAKDAYIIKDGGWDFPLDS